MSKFTEEAHKQAKAALAAEELVRQLKAAASTAQQAVALAELALTHTANGELERAEGFTTGARCEAANAGRQLFTALS